MLKDVGRFLVAVTSYWLGLAGGGFLALLTWLWPSIAQHIGHPEFGVTVPAVIIWGLVGAAFFVAFFRAWRNEAIKVSSLTQQLADLTIPQLSLEIRQIGSAYTSIDGYTAAVFPTASITNKGAPSIADSWTLDVKLNSGEIKHGQLAYMSPDPNMHVANPSGGEFVFGHEDSLYQKAITKPIARGEKITGILFFIVNPVDPKEVAKKGTTFTLSCKDVNGNIVSVNHQFRNDSGPGHGSVKYVPGMTPIIFPTNTND